MDEDIPAEGHMESRDLRATWCQGLVLQSLGEYPVTHCHLLFKNVLPDDYLYYFQLLEILLLTP